MTSATATRQRAVDGQSNNISDFTIRALNSFIFIITPDYGHRRRRRSISTGLASSCRFGDSRSCCRCVVVEQEEEADVRRRLQPHSEIQ